MARAEAFLRAKFHLDPSNRLATIHQRYRKDRTDRTDRQYGPIALGEPFYKRSPNAIGPLSVCPACPVLTVTLVYCGQTVGRIKMKLGTQVGLGPGHIVLDDI